MIGNGFKRTSLVNHLAVDVLLFGSTLELGDVCIIEALTKALAVQREAELFYGDEGNLESYPVFFEPIPLTPIFEDISIIRCNRNPFIKVKDIHVAACSSSSFIQIGNNQNIYLESRVKHIRQLEK